MLTRTLAQDPLNRPTLTTDEIRRELDRLVALPAFVAGYVPVLGPSEVRFTAQIMSKKPYTTGRAWASQRRLHLSIGGLGHPTAVHHILTHELAHLACPPKTNHRIEWRDKYQELLLQGYGLEFRWPRYDDNREVSYVHVDWALSNVFRAMALGHVSGEYRIKQRGKKFRTAILSWARNPS